jgi:hypothetical protein
LGIHAPEMVDTYLRPLSVASHLHINPSRFESVLPIV